MHIIWMILLPVTSGVWLHMWVSDRRKIVVSFLCFYWESSSLTFFNETLLIGLITSREDKIICVNSHNNMAYDVHPKNMILFCIELLWLNCFVCFGSEFFMSVRRERYFCVFWKCRFFCFNKILDCFCSNNKLLELFNFFFFLQKEFFLMNVACFMYL